MKRLTIRNGDGSVSHPLGVTVADVFFRLADFEDIGCEPRELTMEKDRLEAEIRHLKQENKKLGMSLLQAQRDMALLDACEICAYRTPDGGCGAPQDLRLGGGCFTWRGCGE